MISGLAIDGGGNIFATDVFNHLVRKITPAAVVTTVASLPTGSASPDGAYGIGIDASGTIYVANSVVHQILSITQSGTVTVLAGASEQPGATDGIGSAARFNLPQGLTSNSGGTLYVADTLNSTIRKIAPGGVVTTIAGAAGGPGNADGNRLAARFNAPRGVAVGSNGTVYVADFNNCTIRAVTPGGVTRTLAGTISPSQAASCGNIDATGNAAKFLFPSGVAVDASQNVFVADTSNNAIRKITAAGVVTTFAGQAGTQGSADGTGTAARFNIPQGIAVDGAGTLYIADTGNSTIRAITAAGVVTTLAGSAGQTGSTDGTGALARFNNPTGVALDAGGNLYVADLGNHTIRKIAAGGVVTTFAGSAGIPGTTDGTGSAARFQLPSGVAVDATGNLYVAENGNPTIRRITPAGVVTTIGGAPLFADFVDGVGTGARFNVPYGIAVDTAGNLYIADSGNHAIRVGVLTPAAPAITLSPTNKTVDVGATVTFTTAATGNLTPALQWQVSTDHGTTWTDLSDAPPYSGTTTTTLTVTGVSGVAERQSLPGGCDERVRYGQQFGGDAHGQFHVGEPRGAAVRRDQGGRVRELDGGDAGPARHGPVLRGDQHVDGGLESDLGADHGRIGHGQRPVHRGDRQSRQRHRRLDEPDRDDHGDAGRRQSDGGDRAGDVDRGSDRGGDGRARSARWIRRRRMRRASSARLA